MGFRSMNDYQRFRVFIEYEGWKYAGDYEQVETYALGRLVDVGQIEAYVPAIGWTRNFDRPALKPTGTEAKVCEDIAKRQQLGISKYRMTVADNPLSVREWLTHAYEECLDQAVYLKRAIEEIEKDGSDCDMCGDDRSSKSRSTTHNVDLG
jgi:hypothetical protein